MNSELGIEGYKRLRGNGWNFTNSVTVESVRDDYKWRSDPVLAFVQDSIDEDSESKIVKEVLYRRFKEYCKEKEIPLMSKDAFYKTLPSKVNVSSGMYEIEKGAGRKHCFVGIMLTDRQFQLNREMNDQTDQIGHE